jgi:hypothetical protein
MRSVRVSLGLTYLSGRCRPPANHTHLCGSPVTMKQARPIKRALGCGRDGGGSFVVWSGVARELVRLCRVPLQKEGEEALARRSPPILGYGGTEVRWKASCFVPCSSLCFAFLPRPFCPTDRSPCCALTSVEDSRLCNCSSPIMTILKQKYFHTRIDFVRGCILWRCLALGMPALHSGMLAIGDHTRHACNCYPALPVVTGTHPMPLPLIAGVFAGRLWTP